ncbi:MLP-like protein 328 [Ricinus communis]|uniref:Major latex protein, putative n=1 Tax=Ricinus communis TaxID=3988 RepID=B9SFZ7_RICCO|nr:MLP-like protein 328 [Ricinus communis]EEF37413.1 Major latex protein, putative [Ricinus communis]|eukprot:XP_002524916.1 MLP-like protein 328 [Ricinus communis]
MADDMKGQLEVEVEIKSSAEKFFNFWKVQPHQVPNHTPSNIQAVHVHEGDWETPGSIRIWHYTVEGKPGKLKERAELDEENKIVKLIGLEGDVFEHYKVYNPIWHPKPKNEGSLVTVAIEYEKRNSSVPVPQIYVDFMVNMTKEIDEALVKA